MTRMGTMCTLLSMKAFFERNVKRERMNEREKIYTKAKMWNEVKHIFERRNFSMFACLKNIFHFSFFISLKEKKTSFRFHVHDSVSVILINKWRGIKQKHFTCVDMLQIFLNWQKSSVVRIVNENCHKADKFEFLTKRKDRILCLKFEAKKIKLATMHIYTT